MESLPIFALFCMFSHMVWGHGGHGGGGGKPLEFSSEIHNKDHILEHLQHVISTKPKDQLTDEELEFHYFKLHDYDNNNKLDGVEIGKALTHYHDDVEKNATNADARQEKQDILTDEKLSLEIDRLLKDYDLDSDGYVEYPEYKLSAKKEPKDKSESTSESDTENKKEPPKVFADDEIANIVDSVILENDSNADGYIEYFEFKKKQAELKQGNNANQQQQQQQQQDQQPEH